MQEDPTDIEVDDSAIYKVGVIAEVGSF